MSKDKKKKKKKKGKKKQQQQQELLQALFDSAIEVQVAVVVDTVAAAKTTIGLLTAGRAIHEAHDTEQDCQPFHEALDGLLHDAVTNPPTAALIIKHLTTMASAVVSPEEIQDMAIEIANADVTDE